MVLITQINKEGYPLDFNETWCVCITFGAHHPFKKFSPTHHIVSDLQLQIWNIS